MAFLLSILALYGSTLGIVALDKSMRAGKASSSDAAPQFGEEPGWGVLIALCIILNLVALPYYFYATRRSALWGLLGFGAFGACFVLMLVVRVVVAMAVH